MSQNSSLSWVGYPLYCGGLMTEGTFITTVFECDVDPIIITFGPGRSGALTADARPPDGTGMLVTSTIPASEIVLSVYAVGVFLSDQTWSTSSPEPPTSSTSSASSETAKTKITLSPTSAGADFEITSGQEDTSGLSRDGLIGAIVGSILGAALLFGLGFFLVRRHRNRSREATRINDFQDAQGKDKHFNGHEHELEGTQGEIYKWRPELDGDATRAELDHNNMRVELDVLVPVELDATGMYVQGHKPKETD